MTWLTLALPLVLLGCGYMPQNSSPSTPSPATNAAPLAAATPAPFHLPTPSIISGGELNDQALELPQPEYPRAASAVHASGEVVVQVVVDRKGNVIAASGFSGHTLLRAAAEKAAKKAKFAPTISDGEVKVVSGTLKYRFEPN